MDWWVDGLDCDGDASTGPAPKARKRPASPPPPPRRRLKGPFFDFSDAFLGLGPLGQPPATPPTEPAGAAVRWGAVLGAPPQRPDGAAAAAADGLDAGRPTDPLPSPPPERAGDAAAGRAGPSGATRDPPLLKYLKRRVLAPGDAALTLRRGAAAVGSARLCDSGLIEFNGRVCTSHRELLELAAAEGGGGPLECVVFYGDQPLSAVLKAAAARRQLSFPAAGAVEAAVGAAGGARGRPSRRSSAQRSPSHATGAAASGSPAGAAAAGKARSGASKRPRSARASDAAVQPASRADAVGAAAPQQKPLRTKDVTLRMLIDAKFLAGGPAALWIRTKWRLTGDKMVRSADVDDLGRIHYDDVDADGGRLTYDGDGGRKDLGDWVGRVRVCDLSNDAWGCVHTRATSRSDGDRRLSDIRREFVEWFNSGGARGAAAPPAAPAEQGAQPPAAAERAVGGTRRPAPAAAGSPGAGGGRERAKRRSSPPQGAGGTPDGASDHALRGASPTLGGGGDDDVDEVPEDCAAGAFAAAVADDGGAGPSGSQPLRDCSPPPSPPARDEGADRAESPALPAECDDFGGGAALELDAPPAAMVEEPERGVVTPEAAAPAAASVDGAPAAGGAHAAEREGTESPAAAAVPAGAAGVGPSDSLAATAAAEAGDPPTAPAEASTSAAAALQAAEAAAAVDTVAAAPPSDPARPSAAAGEVEADPDGADVGDLALPPWLSALERDAAAVDAQLEEVQTLQDACAQGDRAVETAGTELEEARDALQAAAAALADGERLRDGLRDGAARAAADVAAYRYDAPACPDNPLSQIGAHDYAVVESQALSLLTEETRRKVMLDMARTVASALRQALVDAEGDCERRGDEVLRVGAEVDAAAARHAARRDEAAIVARKLQTELDRRRAVCASLDRTRDAVRAASAAAAPNDAPPQGDVTAYDRAWIDALKREASALHRAADDVAARRREAAAAAAALSEAEAQLERDVKACDAAERVASDAAKDAESAEADADALAARSVGPEAWSAGDALGDRELRALQEFLGLSMPLPREALLDVAKAADAVGAARQRNRAREARERAQRAATEAGQARDRVEQSLAAVHHRRVVNDRVGGALSRARAEFERLRGEVGRVAVAVAAARGQALR